MAIMRLLAEIYQIPELKLNLKFEIELLCNHLGLELNGLQFSKIIYLTQGFSLILLLFAPDIKPSEALKDRMRPDSQDFTAPPPASAPGTTLD